MEKIYRSELIVVGTTWGACVDVMRTSTIALVNSVADFVCSIWLNSKHVHLIDVQLNESLRRITGTVKSTPLPWMSVLSNIMPAEIRRKNCLSRLISSSNFYKNSLLFDVLQERPIERLISRTTTVWNTIELVKNFDPIMEWKIS